MRKLAGPAGSTGLVGNRVRKHPLAGAAVVVLMAGAVLVAGAGPAAADASTPLYVNNASGSNCSDSGAGTQAQPYCKISVAVAAVQSGQTINVASGTYDEHVTINKSGTTGNPITLQRQGTTGAVTLSGSDAGITIDGQHDISVIGFIVSGVTSGSGIALSNSTGITLQNDAVHAASTAAIVGVQLTAVTDSVLEHVISSAPQMSTAIALDGATARVTVRNASAVNNTVGGPAGKGIDIAGSNNTVVDSFIKNANLAGIMIESGATNNIVANNYVLGANGSGIYNNGAIGTAITNNTVRNSCATGIRVDGASSGVSVQNNVVSMDPRSSPACASPSATAVDIGAYDSAVHDTIVDYNTVYQGYTGTPYAWNTVMGLAAFRKASGQAAHDIESSYTNVNIDSANSGAPGFQDTDYYGHSRQDDLPVPNTGVGPISYADRGYTETLVAPTAQLNVTVDKSTNSVTANASHSTPGGAPIASYTFDFGDGSKVTQSTPVATHQYAHTGTYTISVTVTDTAGLTASASQGSACVRGTAPVSPGGTQLRADFNGDHVDDVALFYDYGGGHVALFTMTAQGCGEFDPPVLRWQAPYWGGGTRFVTSGDFNGDGK
ncbi:PKD domain-containing protein, partial [Planosporangium flavigriseum]